MIDLLWQAQYSRILTVILKNIPVVSCDEIRATLCPPYDVIKCDIEGAEWEFLSHYQSIIKESHFFILEWHSWHTGKGGQKQIIEKFVL